MKSLKIFAVAMMLLASGTPTMADNDNNGSYSTNSNHFKAVGFFHWF